MDQKEKRDAAIRKSFFTGFIIVQGLNTIVSVAAVVFWGIFWFKWVGVACGEAKDLFVSMNLLHWYFVLFNVFVAGKLFATGVRPFKMWSTHIIHVFLSVTLTVFQLAFMLPTLNNMHYKLQCLNQMSIISNIEILLSLVPSSIFLHLVFLLWLGFHPPPNMKLNKPFDAYEPPGVPSMLDMNDKMNSIVKEYVCGCKDASQDELSMQTILPQLHQLEDSDLPEEYKDMLLTTISRLYEAQLEEVNCFATSFISSVHAKLQKKLGYIDMDIVCTIVNGAKALDVASPAAVTHIRQYSADVMGCLENAHVETVPAVITKIKEHAIAPPEEDTAPINNIDFADVKVSLKVKCICDATKRLAGTFMKKHLKLEDALANDIIQLQLRSINDIVPLIARNIADKAGLKIYELTFDSSMQNHLIQSVKHMLGDLTIDTSAATNVPTALRDIVSQIEGPLNSFLASYSLENVREVSIDLDLDSYIEHVHRVKVPTLDVVIATVHHSLPSTISDIVFVPVVSAETLQETPHTTGSVMEDLVNSQNAIFHQLFPGASNVSIKQTATKSLSTANDHSTDLHELLDAHHGDVHQLFENFHIALGKALLRIEKKVKPQWLSRSAALKLAAVGIGAMAAENSGNTEQNMASMDRDLENNLGDEGLLLDFAPPDKVDCAKLMKPLVLLASLLRMYPFLSKFLAVLLGIFMLIIGMIGFVAFSTWYDAMFTKFDQTGKDRFSNTYGVMLWIQVFQVLQCCVLVGLLLISGPKLEYQLHFKVLIAVIMMVSSAQLNVSSQVGFTLSEKYSIASTAATLGSQTCESMDYAFQQCSPSRSSILAAVAATTPMPVSFDNATFAPTLAPTLTPFFMTPTPTIPVTSQPTPAPPTDHPATFAPDTLSPPTLAPPTQPPVTLEPTSVPTSFPSTSAPDTPAPPTAVPTASPPTPAPATNAPPTPAPPTAAPPTPFPPTPSPPTQAPATNPPLTAVPTSAPPTISPPTPVPPTLSPPTPSPPTPAPLTQAPPTQAPPTLAPSTAAPPSPAPPTQAPPTSIPLTPAPNTAAPTASPPTTPPTDAPPTDAPPTPAPSTQSPPTPFPPTPSPPTLAPPTPAPPTLAPPTPAPPTPSPPTSAPPTPAPPTPAPPTPAPPTPAPPTPAPPTLAPPTPAPPTPAPPTLAPPTPAPPTPAPPTPAPPTPAPPTPAPPTPAPPTPAPPTLAPPTPVPPTIAPSTLTPPSPPLTNAPPTNAPPTVTPTNAPPTATPTNAPPTNAPPTATPTSSPLTPIPETPAPATSEPDAPEDAPIDLDTPSPDTSEPDTPVPQTPAPDTAAPAPIPDTLAPSTLVPNTPVTPAPDTPAPVTPPVTPAPDTLAPVTPPVTPAPDTLAPGTPPVTPAPDTPAPVTPAPNTLAPNTPAPDTPAPDTLVPGTTPVPTTPAPDTSPPTPAPGPDTSAPTSAPDTLAPNTAPPDTTPPATKAPDTPAPAMTPTLPPDTSAPDTSAPVTPTPTAEPTQGPDTLAPLTQSPPTSAPLTSVPATHGPTIAPTPAPPTEAPPTQEPTLNPGSPQALEAVLEAVQAAVAVVAGEDTAAFPKEITPEELADASATVQTAGAASAVSLGANVVLGALVSGIAKLGSKKKGGDRQRSSANGRGGGADNANHEYQEHGAGVTEELEKEQEEEEEEDEEEKLDEDEADANYFSRRSRLYILSCSFAIILVSLLSLGFYSAYWNEYEPYRMDVDKLLPNACSSHDEFLAISGMSWVYLLAPLVFGSVFAVCSLFDILNRMCMLGCALGALLQPFILLQQNLGSRIFEEANADELCVPGITCDKERLKQIGHALHSLGIVLSILDLAIVLFIVVTIGLHNKRGYDTRQQQLQRNKEEIAAQQQLQPPPVEPRSVW